MFNRLKEIRKNANLTQNDFASKIGASRGMIAKYETGLVIPDSSMIELICMKFNVNRTWLETGEGEPYKQSALIPELLRIVQASPNLQETLERVFSVMTDAEWQAFDDFLGRITKKEP